ncbi:hypothetical protein [Xanthomonas sp. NCPPB 2632]|uniref:hypothetical protein n=1 Tax=Xanthomonas sp. NCPPB 2632 TaxID=3240912 RepID=UPI00351321CD
MTTDPLTPPNAMSNADVHREAMMTFRHYDTLSATAIGAIPLAFAGVCTVLHNVGVAPWRWLVPVSGAALIMVLFAIYCRLDRHAHTALKVAGCLETGGTADGDPVLGLASVRHAMDKDNTKFTSLKSGNGGVLFWCVLSMALAAAVLLVLLAVACFRSAEQVI